MKQAVIITGPTASGKTSLAISLARRLDTQIVSADSRQVYQGIPIVTAMPTAEERAAVRHHLIDFLPLEARYSAARFEQDALGCLSELFARSDYAVVCGGSMMYIDALCHGLDELPEVPDEIRNSVVSDYEKYGESWLRLRLMALDPDYYAKADLMNIKRLLHAVEVSIAAGRPYSSMLDQRRADRDFKIVKVVLDIERPKLFERINTRVDAMVAEGLEEEARSVYDRCHLNSLNTVGLKEMFELFRGNMDRTTAIERIKKNTRVYAKKQMTWWRRDEEAVFIDPLSPDAVDRILDLCKK